MKQFLDLVRDLCFLRRGPQDLPYSTNLLAACVFAALVPDLVRAASMATGELNLGGLLISTLVLLALPYIALKLANLDARYVQTTTALFACTAVFVLLSMPVVLGIGKLPETPADVTPMQGLLGWLGLILIGWQLAVRGNILKHALNLPLRLGVLIAVVFAVVEALVTIVLFGREAA